MTFNISNYIEICDLDCVNTSFHNGLFYCLALKIKPNICPSEDWITVFRDFFKMRGYEIIEIVRSESFFILRLPVSGIGFYEAKSTIKNIMSVIKITNGKLQHISDNQEHKVPPVGEDFSSLFFDSFRMIISHE